MDIRGLIFDIGGSVFDWQTAVLEALEQALSPAQHAALDAKQFAYDVRAGFLSLNARSEEGVSFRGARRSSRNPLHRSRRFFLSVEGDRPRGAQSLRAKQGSTGGVKKKRPQ